MRDNDEVLYLEKIPGKKGLEMRSRVGHRMPLAATGVGKALLLDADEPQWKALHRVGGPVSSRAPGGQQGWEAFRERMRGYAAQGYAFDLEDNEPSIRCVAAPVRDASSGIVAAISVSSTVPICRWSAWTRWCRWCVTRPCGSRRNWAGSCQRQRQHALGGRTHHDAAVPGRQGRRLRPLGRQASQRCAEATSAMSPMLS